MKFTTEGTPNEHGELPNELGDLPAEFRGYVPYSVGASKTIHLSTGAAYSGAICPLSSSRPQGIPTLWAGRTYTLCPKCVRIARAKGGAQ